MCPLHTNSTTSLFQGGKICFIELPLATDPPPHHPTPHQCPEASMISHPALFCLADCRACGVLICSTCSVDMRLPTAIGYGRTPVRCCTTCKESRYNLLHVSQKGDAVAVECLLRWGLYGESLPRGRNVLMLASEQCSATSVKCLTECGFPTSEIDVDGWSALHISASRGDLHSVKCPYSRYSLILILILILN